MSVRHGPVATLILSGLLAAAPPAPGSEERIEIVETTPRGEPGNLQGDFVYPVAVLTGAGWERDQIEQAIRKAEAIYAQCGVMVTAGTVYWMKTPDEFHALDEIEQAELLSRLPPERPLAVFVDRTTDDDIAYSYLKSAPVASQGTAWITRRGHDSCVGSLLAHELGHILLNTAQHSSERHNIMAYSCTHSNIVRSQTNTRLSEAQCRQLRAGLMSPAD